MSDDRLATLVQYLEGLSSPDVRIRFATLGDLLTRYGINISEYIESRANAAHTVDEFAADPEHPFFDEVSADIVDRLHRDSQVTLTQAYEDAVWANPITRQKEIARRQFAGRSSSGVAGAQLRH